MVSSYLERPLRTVKQAIEDRARAPVARSTQPAGPSAAAAGAPPGGPDLTGPGSVDLLVRLLSENVDQYSAVETPTPGPALTHAAARQRSPADRRRAA